MAAACFPRSPCTVKGVCVVLLRKGEGHARPEQGEGGVGGASWAPRPLVSLSGAGAASGLGGRCCPRAAESSFSDGARSLQGPTQAIANSRSVMLLNVLGCTRTTMVQ